MNITDNIQFDNNLIGNESVNLKYSGYLFQNGENEVDVLYGYDDDWKNASKKKMTKTEDGFVCNINVFNFSSFNFCFLSSNGLWDSNYGKNFSTPIKRRETSKKFIINENLLPSILNELIEYDVSKIEKQTKIEKQFTQVAVTEPVIEETPVVEMSAPSVQPTSVNVPEIDFNSFEDFEESTDEVDVDVASVLDEAIDVDFSNSEDDSLSPEEKARISYVVENYDDIHNNNSNIIKNISEINVSSLISDRYATASSNLSMLFELLHKSLDAFKSYEQDEVPKIQEEKAKLAALEEQSKTQKVEDASIDVEFEREFDMDSLVDSLLSPIVSEKEINKDDITNFDVDNLVKTYRQSFENVEEPSTDSAIDSNGVVYNKVTVDEPVEFKKISIEELGESVKKGLDESLIDSPVEIYAKVNSNAEKKQVSFSPDFAKKKALLDEIDMLFEGSDINEIEKIKSAKTEQTPERTNEEKLYELESGTTVEEDIKEVNRLIDETENTIKSIQNLFDEIHTLNEEPVVPEITPEEEKLFLDIDSLDCLDVLDSIEPEQLSATTSEEKVSTVQTAEVSPKEKDATQRVPVAAPEETIVIKPVSVASPKVSEDTIAFKQITVDEPAPEIDFKKIEVTTQEATPQEIVLEAEQVTEPAKIDIAEETSLFDKYEDDSNRYPNIIPSQEDEDEYENNQATSTSDNEDKFLVVSNKSLSTSKKISNKFKLPFLKLHKFLSSTLGKIFD